MGDEAVLGVVRLGFPWQTVDPFLFCVHHLDHYPAGNDQMGPDPALLQGRNIGSDFQPSHVGRRMGGQHSSLRRSYRECELGGYRRTLRFAGVGVQSGRYVH